MKIKSILSFAASSAALLLALPAIAENAPAAPAKSEASAKIGKLIRVTEKDAAWAAEARKTYPLQTCITSDEKLGGMGKPADFIYRVEGEADRLIRFCCAGCKDDFLAEPAKFLSKLETAKGKSASTSSSSCCAPVAAANCCPVKVTE